MARNRQLTEKRILEAARHLLAGEGFESWGINEIARQAGVDKVLLYRYFNSLDGLLSSVIQSTDFWPDPAELPDKTAEAFIENTLEFLAEQPQAHALLAHPGARGPVSEIRRKYSSDLDRWLGGIRENSRGSIAAEQLDRLTALIYYQTATGIRNLTARELWKQVSPPLEWEGDRQWVVEDELPTELL